eukprot:c1296_g1_i1.p1 GENE.c1296_g1_i1~~c1296_g1_i1.p1  ORF type:complete len:444 (+),score=113.06 c1296_g1_i1:64-1395(+)
MAEILKIVGHVCCSAKITSSKFTAFKWTYLRVYFFMSAADWLQGPYMYDLYASYGFTQHQIAVLFVFGFGSSFLLGTYIGSLADRFGRRNWALLYVVLYVGSCATKHFNNYRVLLVGRVLGGISTSLLFSVFDSWMVRDHHSQGFPADWLSETFSAAMFGNSLVAIVCGILSQKAVELLPLTPVFGHVMWGGSCTPFDLAALCLVIGGVLVVLTWHEHHRPNDVSSSSSRPLIEVFKSVVSNRDILLTGLVQALFEGSMYTFVFLWTPAITTNGHRKPPYGLIFSIFMLACMIGSLVFSQLSQSLHLHSSLIICFPLAISTAALAVPALLTSNPLHIVVAFVVFEVCVGVYYPAIGTLKSAIVPERDRAATYNIFRAPLNVIVLCVLLTGMSVQRALLCCVGMLGLATLFAVLLHMNRSQVQRSYNILASSMSDAVQQTPSAI